MRNEFNFFKAWEYAFIRIFSNYSRNKDMTQTIYSTQIMNHAF